MNDTSMVELTRLVSNLGFPIFAFMLMYKLVDQTIKENTKALADISKTMESMKAMLHSLLNKEN